MRIPVKHVTPALLAFLLLAACGRQKVTFRSMAGDKPVGTEVQANSSGDGTTGAVTPLEVAKVGTCTMVLERSEIDLGASPKVKVSLPDSKELSSLAINGEAADVSAAEHELTAVTASGSAKIIAVAIDKENRSYMCTAGLTVKTPVTSGLSLVSPTCSLVPESLSVKSGEGTKLRITLANLDATKFKLNSASLSKSGDLDAVVLESLPVTRATGALPAGRHVWTARVQFGSVSGGAVSSLTTQCSGEVLSLPPPEAPPLAICSLSLNPSRISAGGNTKATVTLPDGSSISSLAIDGTTYDPSIGEQTLPTMEVAGTVKVVAVAVDEAGLPYSCSGSVTVDQPALQSVSVSTPSCALTPDAVAVVSGSATSLKLNLLNADPTKFRLLTTKFYNNATPDTVESIASLPASKPTGALAAGRYAWTAKMDLEYLATNPTRTFSIQCGAEIVVTDPAPSCTAQVDLGGKSAALNAAAKLVVSAPGLSGSVTYPSSVGTSKNLEPASGTATFDVTLAQTGWNIFPAKLETGAGTTLCFAQVNVPSPGAGPECSVTASASTMRVREPNAIRMAVVNPNAIYTEIAGNIEITSNSTSDASLSQCSLNGGLACVSAGFASTGLKVVKGILTGKDPSGATYRRECSTTISVTEPAAACEVVFKSPASPADATRASMTFAGSDVSVPFGVRQASGSGAVVLPFTVTMPDGSSLLFPASSSVALAATQSMNVTAASGTGDRAFTCLANGPGGSSQKTSVLTVNSTIPPAMSCTVMLSPSATAGINAGEKTRVRMVMNATGTTLASAQFGQLPALQASAFTKVSDTQSYIESDYVFYLTGEVLAGKITDATGSTVSCSPVFESGKITERTARNFVLPGTFSMSDFRGFGIDPADGNKMYAIDGLGKAYRSADKGTSWSEVCSVAYGMNDTSTAGADVRVNPKDGKAYVMDQYGAYMSRIETPASETTCPKTRIASAQFASGADLDSWVAFHPQASRMYYWVNMGNSQTGLSYSDDGGATNAGTIFSMTSGQTYSLAVDPSTVGSDVSQTRVLSVASGGNVYRNGTLTTNVGSGPSSKGIFFHPRDSQYVYLGMSGYYSSNAGASFAYNSEYRLHALDANGAGYRLELVGSAVTLRKAADMKAPSFGTLYTFQGEGSLNSEANVKVSGSSVLAMFNRKLFVSGDSGTTFKVVKVNSSSTLINPVSVAAYGDTIYALYGEKILKSTDDGKSWTFALASIAGYTSNSRLGIGSAAKKVYLSLNLGNQSTQRFMVTTDGFDTAKVSALATTTNYGSSLPLFAFSRELDNVAYEIGPSPQFAGYCATRKTDNSGTSVVDYLLAGYIRLMYYAWPSTYSAYNCGDLVSGSTPRAEVSPFDTNQVVLTNTYIDYSPSSPYPMRRFRFLGTMSGGSLNIWSQDASTYGTDPNMALGLDVVRSTSGTQTIRAVTATGQVRSLISESFVTITGTDESLTACYGQEPREVRSATHNSAFMLTYCQYYNTGTSAISKDGGKSWVKLNMDGCVPVDAAISSTRAFFACGNGAMKSMPLSGI